MKDKTYNIIILVLILVALNVGYGVYKSSIVDNKKSEEHVTQDDIKNSGSIVLDEEGNPSGVFEVIDNNLPLENKPVIVVPDLRRPIVVLEDLSPETEKISRDKITSLTEVLKKDNEFFSGWLELAAYRKIIGDYLGAVEIWEFMTGAWPDSVIAYDNLGNIYHYQLRDFHKSESYFRQAISKDLKYIPTYINFHELYLLSYDEKRDLADDILLEGLINNPGNILLLSTLAEYYADLGDKDSAKVYYGQALGEAEKMTDVNLKSQIQARIDALDNK